MKRKIEGSGGERGIPKSLSSLGYLVEEGVYEMKIWSFYK